MLPSRKDTAQPILQNGAQPKLIPPSPFPVDAQAYFYPLKEKKGVFCIALNRPKAKNAISVQMLQTFAWFQDFEAALDQAYSEPILSVLILHSSTAGSFCAGADLIERRGMSEEQVRKFLAALKRAFGRLEALPVPTICAIDGPALGGGLELALACDFRVAASDVTKISLPEVRLGIIPGAGGTQRLPRLIGTTKAKELIFTGKALTAREAEKIGLVDYISDPSSTAYERACMLADEMSSSAPLALRAAKAAISKSLELPLEEALKHETKCYKPLLETRDRIEALDAFREKRKPVFLGR
ncbi:ClpP/crotonase [Fistulina hepatica ATCC 64428]|uniref:ClpP/crotonase n=1 Tax=Fistulina hepatica ATCC 64428 TaxID=1128425 RepID=A0A0D7ADI0_9AGAR|nr:ClpP/crotonase [Fistulina hepatica ATCC 64428]